ncbi:MAG TPA: hypothetical protein VKU36_04530 [Candidatus Babeliales bacterium]|nr:hypothetical protein [Candidatus Babeliales bacterium]
MNYFYCLLIIFIAQISLSMEKNKTIDIHNQTKFPVEVRLKESGIQHQRSKIKPWDNIRGKKEIAPGTKENLIIPLVFAPHLIADSYHNDLVVNYSYSPNRVAIFEDPLSTEGGTFVVKETKAKYNAGLSVKYQYGLK